MLHIYIDSQEADCFVDQNFSMSIENPFFDTEGIPISYAIELELPRTVINRKLLGEDNRMFIEINKQTIEVYFAQYLLFRGVVDSRSLGGESFFINCIGANVPDNIEDALTKMDFGSEVIYNDPGSDNLYRKLHTLLKEDFVYPPLKAQGVDFVTETTEGEAVKKNPVDSLSVYDNYFDYLGDGYFVKSYMPGNPTPYLVSGMRVPVFMLSWFFPKLIPLVNNIFASPEFSKLCLIPPLVRQHSSLMPIPPHESVEYKLSRYFDKQTVSELLKDIINLFGISLYARGEKFEMIYNRDILNSVATTDWTDIISDDNISISFESGESYTINFSGGDYDSAPKGANVLIVDSYSAMISMSQKYPNGMHFCVGNDIYYYDIEVGFSYVSRIWDSQGEDGGDRSVSVSILPIATNIGAYYSKITPTPPYTTIEYSGVAFNRFLSGIHVKDSSCIGYLTQGVFTSSIFDFHKEITAEYLTSNKYDKDGIAISNATISLKEDSVFYDLYHKKYKGFIAESKNTITGKVFLSAKDVSKIDISKKIIYRNKEYLIKTLDVNVSNHIIDLSDFELVAINVL